MNDRDELSDIVSDHTDWADVRSGSNNAADAILAAGYRKPRVVTTAEELEELPAGTVVKGKYCVYQRWITLGGVWTTPGREISPRLTSNQVLLEEGGAEFTVLYTPEGA